MRNRLLVGLAVALAAIALPATASTFIAMDQNELLTASSAVVQGKVLDVRSFWNEDNTIIVTEARVEVAELVAGAAPAVVTVKTFGGEVGDYRIEAHGFPTFAAGEQVLLYLEQDGRDYRVAGYRQGQYRVVDTPKGKVAKPTLEEGVRLFTKTGQLAPRPATVELDVLKNNIRSARDLVGGQAIR